MITPTNSPQQSFLEWCLAWSLWGLGRVLTPDTLLVDLNTWNDLIRNILSTTAFVISITVGTLTLLKLLGYKLPQIKLKRKPKNASRNKST